MSYILRDYQKNASDNVIMDICAGNRKVCSVLSTGAGKTIIMIDVAKRFMDLYKQKTLVLSDSSILTDQNANRFRTFLPEVKTGILQGQ